MVLYFIELDLITLVTCFPSQTYTNSCETHSRDSATFPYTLMANSHRCDWYSSKLLCYRNPVPHYNAYTLYSSAQLGWSLLNCNPSPRLTGHEIYQISSVKRARYMEWGLACAMTASHMTRIVRWHHLQALLQAGHNSIRAFPRQSCYPTCNLYQERMSEITKWVGIVLGRLCYSFMSWWMSPF